MTLILSGSDGVTFPDSTEQETGYANGIGFRNRIINGDMRIAQRGTSANPTVSGYYTVDRWLQGGGAVLSTIQAVVSQSTDAPAGFTNSYSYVNTNAYTLLTTEAVVVIQRIEGFNTADLMWGTASAKTITFSFWVKSSLTGKFSIRLSNNAQDRFYATTYTINTASTWEYKTVTVAGDTSGTWLTNNGIGIDLRFFLGSGPDRLGTPDAWSSTNVQGPSDMVQLTETAGATWQITGVQLEVGSVATPFERRPYGTELMLCQRYYYKMQATAAGGKFGLTSNSSTTQSYSYTQFLVPMRTKPTALEQSGNAGDYSIFTNNSVVTLSVVPSFSISENYFIEVELTVASGLTGGNVGVFRAVNSSAFLAWSAEL